MTGICGELSLPHYGLFSNVGGGGLTFWERGEGLFLYPVTNSSIRNKDKIMGKYHFCHFFLRITLLSCFFLISSFKVPPNPNIRLFIFLVYIYIYKNKYIYIFYFFWGGVRFCPKRGEGILHTFCLYLYIIYIYIYEARQNFGTRLRLQTVPFCWGKKGTSKLDLLVPCKNLLKNIPIVKIITKSVSKMVPFSFQKGTFPKKGTFFKNVPFQKSTVTYLF